MRLLPNILSWEFLNKLVKGKEIIPEKSALYAGTISAGVALEFVQFSKIFENIVTIAQILNDPFNCVVPTDSSLRWATLTSVLEHVDSKNFTAIAEYADRFSMDFRIFFYRALLVKLPSIKSHAAFIDRLIALSKYLD